MVKDRELARTAMVMAEAFIRGVNGLLQEAQERCSPDEYEAFKRGVGISMGTVDMRLLEPLYRVHPDLMPEGYELTPAPPK